jgi:hypothetical protein
MDDQQDLEQPPHQFSLLGITLSRFREAFGEAVLSVEKDYQWTLKTSPFGCDVHVLLHGLSKRPIVWIFDANDRNDGVSRSMIEHEDAIIEVIDHIRDRIKRGSRIARKARNSQEADE